MPPANDQLTPLWKQYWEIKKQYPDVLLLFRLGDFYELFGQDAEVASAVLEITLTGREQKGERIPMCGVPHHAAERYVARLIAAGHRVAICEQIEDPRFAKGIVRRKVTRVITPGTVLDDSMLDARSNSYLVALAASDPDRDRAEFGLAVCDVSTGEFAVTHIRGTAAARRLTDELERLSPRELLLPRALHESWAAWLGEDRGWTLTCVEPEALGRKSAKEFLLEHFQVHSLRGFGCEDLPLAQEAARLVLAYLGRRHIEAGKHLRSLATYSIDSYMGLDPTARRNLELTQTVWDGQKARSLLATLDSSSTPMGGRLFRRRLEQPFVDPRRINAHLDAVEELTRSALLRGDIRELLKGIADLERLASRAATGTCSPRDLGSLRTSLHRVPDLRSASDACSSEHTRQVVERLEPLDALVDRLDAALVDEPPNTVREGGIIREGYSSHLDDLRNSSREGKEWIAGLETTERERTGIKSLKVGYNSVFGYYIEITRANLALAPDNYIRKQTTAGAERFITPELKEREALILGAEERMQDMEQRLFVELRDVVARAASEILAVAAAIAELDLIAAFAETAVRLDYTRPMVDDGPVIEIAGGRHPVVERLVSEPFVPNDAHLSAETDRLLIITGPNMAGKATYLRQVALIVLMAQAGCFVPAEQARVGVVDRIFTRVGAHDDLAGGQSTFMVEMSETASILNNATDRSLIILDEIGRGTSTYDGLSIAWAVCEHILALGARCLFATHYHHLNELAERMEGVRNYRAAVKEDERHVVWLHRIVEGGTDRSYGIQVARLAGAPEPVIARAREILEELESGARAPGAVPKPAAVPAKRKRVQLSLFELDEHPVVEELRKLDLSTTTPIEALTLLYQLQKRANQRS